MSFKTQDIMYAILNLILMPSLFQTHDEIIKLSTYMKMSYTASQ